MNIKQLFFIGLFSVLLVACGAEEAENEQEQIEDEITNPISPIPEPEPVTDYSMSGSISGAGSELTLELARNEQFLEAVTVPQGVTDFEFNETLSLNDAYMVTLSADPANQECSIDNGTGVIIQNINNIVVSCNYIANQTITGSSSTLAGDISLKLIVNGDEESAESLDILYNDPIVVPDFITQVAINDVITIEVVEPSLHQNCSVEYSSVVTEFPSYVLSCVDHCGSDSQCLVWRTEHNSVREQLNNGEIEDDGTNGYYPIPNPLLPQLVWSDDLAQVAQAHADSCAYGHNSNRETQYNELTGENVTAVGENIAVNYFTTPSKTQDEYIASQVAAWASENVDWHLQTYDNATINGAVHFTQIIWANTIEVGCGSAFCENMNNDFDGYYGVCNYLSAGNYTGQFPYTMSP